MEIRSYQPGYEAGQAEIYNTAAALLPAFKPATAEEVRRRYQSSDLDPTSKCYAFAKDRMVGYAVFNPNGRISYPWCLPEFQHARQPLLEEVLSGLKQRGVSEAWVAYRGDWKPVLDFLRDHGFIQTREIINYVAELSRLPHDPVPEGREILPVRREELPEVLRLGKGLFAVEQLEPLTDFFLSNSYFDPSALYVLKDRAKGKTLGFGVAIINPKYADPTKLDAAMPCFRLGALGTESERHKRVNGMFACGFEDGSSGEVLLAEAVRRFKEAGLTHAAAQGFSDHPAVCRFFDRFFARQGAVPILARRCS